jgi:hypothetical protein
MSDVATLDALTTAAAGRAGNSARSVSLAWRDRPFDGQFHHAMIALAERPPTIAEILANAASLPAHFRTTGEVRVNGDLVPRDMWDRVRPRGNAGTEIAITLHMPIRSGGGQDGSGTGGKNTLAMVATIAVLLIATAVSGGALGLPAIGFLSAGAVSALAGAGICTGGKLSVAALSPSEDFR